MSWVARRFCRCGDGWCHSVAFDKRWFFHEELCSGGGNAGARGLVGAAISAASSLSNHGGVAAVRDDARCRFSRSPERFGQHSSN